MLKPDCVEGSGERLCLFVTHQETRIPDPISSRHLTDHQFGVCPDDKMTYAPIPSGLKSGDESLILRLVICPVWKNPTL
jgi:hypothetical protein